MQLEKNLGVLDMVLRLGLSAVAIYVGFIDPDAIADQLSSIVIGIIGAINLVAALFRHCPFYSLAGINTCKLG